MTDQTEAQRLAEYLRKCHRLGIFCSESDKAAALLIELESRLTRYGCHDEGCAIPRWKLDVHAVSKPECTCGFAEALK